MISTATLPATPLAETDRAELLDSLRGFALFGVCLANIFSNFSFWGEAGAPPVGQLPTAATDPAAAFLIKALIDGKFYSLFSLLFGVGFAIQLQRATARGDNQLGAYRRRLWVLLGIGLVHLLTIWLGDILAFYALVGFLLVRLRHLSDRAIFRWAVGLLLVPVLGWGVYWLGGGMHAKVPFTPASPFYFVGMALDKQYGTDATYAAFTSASWAVHFKALRAGIFLRTAYLLFEWRLCKVLAMFLLGLWIGRHQVFHHLEAYRPLLRRVAAVGLSLGLAAGLLNAALPLDEAYREGQTPGVVHVVLYALGVGPLALGYAASFGLLWQRPAWQRVLRQLAPLGRMALSAYLGQSLISIFLFSGRGLGWAGHVGPTLHWLLALAIIVGQLLLSRWWLLHFQFGPMEWLWRSLSYGHRQPLRRRAPLAVA